MSTVLLLILFPTSFLGGVSIRKICHTVDGGVWHLETWRGVFGVLILDDKEALVSSRQPRETPLQSHHSLGALQSCLPVFLCHTCLIHN